MRNLRDIKEKLENLSRYKYQEHLCFAFWQKKEKFGKFHNSSKAPQI